MSNDKQTVFCVKWKDFGGSFGKRPVWSRDDNGGEYGLPTATPMAIHTIGGKYMAADFGDGYVVSDAGLVSDKREVACVHSRGELNTFGQISRLGIFPNAEKGTFDVINNAAFAVVAKDAKHVRVAGDFVIYSDGKSKNEIIRNAAGIKVGEVKGKVKRCKVLEDGSLEVWHNARPNSTALNISTILSAEALKRRRLEVVRGFINTNA